MGVRKANLFLIGAAKSGTTALQKMLSEHPDISPLAIKEPGHFCTDLRTTNFSPAYNRLTQWDEAKYFAESPLKEAHLAFVEDPEHYQMLVDHAPATTYVLDASTAYLYSEVAAAELAQYHPEAKLIAILRNPIERAYSHYTMALKYGMEREQPYAAFDREAQLDRAQWGVDECYLELGNYAEQLERYKSHFAENQLLVLFHEDLQKNPQKVLKQVAEFLDLPTFAPVEPVRSNEGSVPKYPAINRMGMRLIAPIRQALPKESVKALKSLMQKAPEALPADARQLLQDYYQPKNEALEQLLHIELQHWK